MKAPHHRKEGPRFRRSPHLVGYWTPQGLVLENFATRRRMAASALAIEILDFFEDGHTRAQLQREFTQYRPALLDRAVKVLERCTLLVRAGARGPAAEPMDAWSPWNPAAGFLHFSTKDVPFVQDSEAWPTRIRRRAQASPMPPSVKSYPLARRVPLPPAEVRGDLPAALLARRTWRRFGSRALEPEALATLLGLTFRIQGWMPIPGVGRLPLKTSPSGGARHSIEAYVLVRRVKGLAPGLYHYAPDHHRLERLKKGATAAQIERYLPGQWWYRGASAVVLMTAVFPRVMWRYGYPRAYRTVLIEAGHLCQTFLLAATWLGLAPFCSMALADSRVERDLGLDGVTESVVYAAGVGTRPPGVESAQVPAPRRRRRRIERAS